MSFFLRLVFVKMSFERNAPKINIKSPLTVLIFKALQSFKKTVFWEYNSFLI